MSSAATTTTAVDGDGDDDLDFLLPSQFLTLADILSDFSAVSTSPQSTLLGCDAASNHRNDDDDNEKQNDAATLELLSKAAGEVAKMTQVLRSNVKSNSNGTGFFDCSNRVKLLKCPPVSPPSLPPPPPPEKNTVLFPPQSPFCSQHYPQFRHFSPHMMVGQVQLPKPQQKKTTKKNDTKTNKNNGNNRPLGLPPSAWPPLPGQAQAQAQHTAGTLVGPPRDSVGTGVFLPRRVTVTSDDHKNKSEVNVLKTKNNKNLQRRDSRPIKGTDDEIVLPSEWVY